MAGSAGPVEVVRAHYKSLQGGGVDVVFDRGIRLGDMQRHLCKLFSKRFPLNQVSLVIADRAYVDWIDKPLLNIEIGAGVDVVFTRTTDMKHFDSCFRGPRPTFDEDMQEATDE